VGLSDPVPKLRTLDERAAEIEAVMDAAGFERAVLFAGSEGGTASIVFAATRPERTRALILTGAFAYSFADSWDDLDRDPAELRARLVRELAEDYTPSVKQLARWQSWSRAAVSAWGSGEAGKALLPSVRSIRQLAMVERMSASPGMARATFEAMFRIDVRPILPTISAPTLVIHARDEVIPVQCGRDLADHIPGARLLEVEGRDHVPWLADPDRILTEVEEFLTGSHAAPSLSRRALRTVLFTDMVASTRRRPAMSGGVRCCTGSTRSPRSSGECEVFDADIGGIAVHIAARIVGEAGAGEILVSRTVRDLVVGSGTGSRIEAASSCAGYPASGNSWRSIATARGRDLPKRNWCQLPLPALGPRCAARTAPLPRWPGAHRGSCAGWRA
jgi:pimeloyl-ACP methyl ester carboxylesterase